MKNGANNLSLHYSVLASGSSGNAMFIKTEKTRLLIDAGLSGKKLEQLFKQIGEDLAQIDAILVTHEHSDHVKGLGVIARRYELPVYANEKTWKELDRLCGDISTDLKFHFELDQQLSLGDIDIHSFGVSHDAVQPMFYCFTHEQSQLSLATDMGYVSQQIKGTLADSDVIIFESNHDVDMVRVCRYPWNVKRRILGDTGHLSNEASGEALADIITDKTKKIYLAHLSQDNNLRDLARMTVEQTLAQREIAVGLDVSLHDTYPDQPTKLVRV